MAMSIEVLGFVGPEIDIDNPFVAAHLVFSNLGKRNIAIAGVFLKIINPADSNNVFIKSWVNRNHEEKTLPAIVPAEQTLLKTIEFEGPQALELEGIASRSGATEIKTTLIVTIVNKQGNLADIRFNSVRFRLNSAGKYTGYIFDSRSSKATLNDATDESSIIHDLPGSYVAY